MADMESKAPTVSEIITTVYGSPAAAMTALGVTSRSALSNWKTWGHFPERLEGKIVADAQAAGVELSFETISGLRIKKAA